MRVNVERKLRAAPVSLLLALNRGHQGRRSGDGSVRGFSCARLRVAGGDSASCVRGFGCASVKGLICAREGLGCTHLAQCLRLVRASILPPSTVACVVFLHRIPGLDICYSYLLAGSRTGGTYRYQYGA